MEISDFFQALDMQQLGIDRDAHPLLISKRFRFNMAGSDFPDLNNVRIALFGVATRAEHNDTACTDAPDAVRKALYSLFEGSPGMHLADLGNIRPGHSDGDTWFAVKSVVAGLIRQKTIPVILGGRQHITYANYLAYENLGQIINLAALDARFDLGAKQDEALNPRNYLSHILTHKPNHLFNYANIGYQSYYVDQDAVELMEKLQFDAYRLGRVREDITEMEPVIRNADMLSIDMSAIRQSDAPGSCHRSPNGFFGEEACQLVRYAGLSEKLSSIGFYEYDPETDSGSQTAMLIAQMIWYFIEGVSLRSHDFPDPERKDAGEFLKYTVSIKDFRNKLVFYKSRKSDRWWMEVPCPDKLRDKYERQLIVPCSLKDYQTACQDEIPEKWWQVYQKFL